MGSESSRYSTGDRGRVVVTGARGFIGSAVVRALEGIGRSPVVVIRPGPTGADATGTAMPKDLTHDDLNDLLDSGDVLVHLAARRPSTFEAREAEAIAEHNYAMDHRIVELCTQREAHLIYASGTSVYGVRPWRGARVETDPVEPTGPYVSEKFAVETLIAGQLATATMLRISSPYGPEQRTRTVLVTFLERAAAGLPLFVDGTGQRQQDFIFVDDVAEAVMAAVRSRAAGVFNIATGRPISMRALADLVVATTGSVSEVRLSGRRDPQEGFTARYSVSRAREDMGWVARTQLADGLVRCARSAPQTKR